MRRSRVKNGDRRKAEQINASQVRACCPTNIHETHLPRCSRPISRCADKVPYSTRDRALAAVDRSTARGQGRMTPYRCGGCELWHIGHPRTVDEGLEASADSPGHEA